MASKNLEQLFEVAKNEESARQEFIDKVVERNPSEFVSEVIYVPDEKRVITMAEAFGSIQMMATSRPNRSYFGIKDGKSKIEVYSWPFGLRDVAVADDFISTLVDHEYFHAEENAKHPKKVTPEFWKFPEFLARQMMRMAGIAKSDKYFINHRIFQQMVELRAYKHQYEQMKFRDCSGDFSRYISRTYSDRAKAVNRLKNQLI